MFPDVIRQLCGLLEYLHFALKYKGSTEEMLKGHLIDTVIVPCLQPASNKEMLPFVENVTNVASAFERLCALAVVVALHKAAAGESNGKCGEKPLTKDAGSVDGDGEDLQEQNQPAGPAPEDMLLHAQAMLRWADSKGKVSPSVSFIVQLNVFVDSKGPVHAYVQLSKDWHMMSSRDLA